MSFKQIPIGSGAKYVFVKQGQVGVEWAHYWEYKDGSEGGELWLQDGEVVDFDGAFDLPGYVKQELIAAGYSIGW